MSAVAKETAQKAVDLLAEAWQQGRDSERAHAEKLAEALKEIKAQVCGDKRPNWQDDWTTTQTRGWIADVCDDAISAWEKTNP